MPTTIRADAPRAPRGSAGSGRRARGRRSARRAARPPSSRSSAASSRARSRPSGTHSSAPRPDGSVPRRRCGQPRRPVVARASADQTARGCRPSASRVENAGAPEYGRPGCRRRCGVEPRRRARAAVGGRSSRPGRAAAAPPAAARRRACRRSGRPPPGRARSDLGRQHRLGRHHPAQRRQRADVLGGRSTRSSDEAVDVAAGEAHLHPAPGATSSACVARAPGSRTAGRGARAARRRDPARPAAGRWARRRLGPPLAARAVEQRELPAGRSRTPARARNRPARRHRRLDHPPARAGSDIGSRRSGRLGAQAPTAALSASTRSVRSQVKSGSSRPKWP